MFEFKKKKKKNAWNMWLSWKRKAIKDLPMLEDKNLGEICGRKRQKSLDWIGRREKVGKSLDWNSEEHERRTFL